ncbi:Hypothetical protein NCS54_01345600 [Fusarium falciforme]|uniref:Hypothetical protein n=1 Tax=Fusarium falciforme TaxID=195108 RepID=UPI0023016C7C|nr:Hypothetical protein NCS54_01345600 [Fusarium falciforme]WAO95812.1 Hypothetical protein NCS54_01345600 [Fusarium falciforme]
MPSTLCRSLIQTYHLPPNFSIRPAPNGPIQLGSILTNLQDVEVLNSDCRVPIDEAKIFSHAQQGFQATASHMRRGELGIWAKAVGFEGLGGELGGSRETSRECKYNFRRLDTLYFSPSPTYRRATMKELDVAEYVEATGWAPVYLVTGLKVAVQPSVQMSTSKSFAALGDAGVSEVIGLPVSIGPRVDFQSQGQSSEGWTTSDDFIYGIRVEKLVFKRRWLSLQRRDEGPLQSKLFTKGAQLAGEGDGSDEEDEEDDIVELELGEHLDGMEKAAQTESGEETLWVLLARFA